IVRIHEIIDEGLVIGAAVAGIDVFSMSIVKIGFPCWSKGFSALTVLPTEISPSLTESHARAESNCVVPVRIGPCFIFSIEPKVSTSVFSGFPGILPPPFGLIDFQYSEWL